MYTAISWEYGVYLLLEAWWNFLDLFLKQLQIIIIIYIDINIIIHNIVLELKGSSPFGAEFQEKIRQLLSNQILVEL